VVALNDRHAIMRLRDASAAVGDWLCFGISDPCTALDKWREIPLVDERYDVVGLAETCFWRPP
jgi:D-serine deaminase-like pyridoxal phosphate-dependent protein